MRLKLIVLLAVCASTFLVLASPLAEALEPQIEQNVAQNTFFNVTGKVMDPNGRPLPSINVTATEAGSPAVNFLASTNSTGMYDLNIPQGTFNISALGPYYISNETYTDLSISGSTSNIDFTMAQTGTITGYITNGTLPLSGVEVVASGTQKEYSAYSSSPNGEYVLSHLLPGYYTVYTEKNGFDDAFTHQPFYLPGGSAQDLDFNLTGQQTKLVGRVTISGNGISGVLVTLTQNNVTYSNYTDHNGDYQFLSVPSGNCSILFSKEGYANYTQSIDLSTSAGNTLNVQMIWAQTSGDQGFIPGYDLPHSLMIVGLIIAFMTVVVSTSIMLWAKIRPPKRGDEEELDESVT